MKKITLFFAALAVAFSASAFDGNLTDGGNAYFGTYDPTTNVFTENENPTQISSFNPACLNFAIQIEQADLLTVLNANPTYTLCIVDLRAGDPVVDPDTYYATTYHSGFRMTRIDNAKYPEGDDVTGIVFYVCGLDLGANSIVLGTTAGYQHLHGGVFVGSPAVEEGEPAYWFDQSAADGCNGYVYMGDATQAMEVTSTCPTCPNVGVAETIADEKGAEVVGFYTILGAELSAEPETGMFIVKYSDGTSAKIVK